MHCHFCKKPILLSGGKASFRESCPACGRDAHICRNCGHYDVSAYNECHEPSADRVVDKEKANYCEYFTPPASADPVGPATAAPSPLDLAAEAKERLEALFKK